MPDKKNDQNRRRKWAPKRRTGCATCKARHVKCDEVRPVCRRCLSSGFKCEGYTLTPKKGSGEDSSSPPEQGDDAPGRKSKPAQKHFPIIAASPEVKVLKESPLPLTLAPGTPYRDVAAQRGIKYFTELTASMVGRSRAAPYFWKVLIPQAAWQYPSVRHAVLASAIMNQALMKKKRAAGDWQSTQLQVMKHTNQAMHSVLTEKLPLDVVLLTSATLGILDLFHGSWDNACIHVTTGAKLAKEAREKGINDPYISFYCQAFASALPGVLRPAQEGKGRKVVHENACVRLEEAVASLEMALADIGCIWAKLKTLEIPDKPRIMIVLNNAKIETEWLLPRWRQLLENERQLLPDKSEPGVPMHEVESPWSVITAKLNDYLDHGGMFDTAKFEIAMERTMPFFTLAKSGPHLQMRELAVELMWRGMLLRKRDESPESIFPLAI